MEIYKARLVARGYTQQYGIDYDETFSLVARIQSIGVILALVAFYDYDTIYEFEICISSGCIISSSIVKANVIYELNIDILAFILH